MTEEGGQRKVDGRRGEGRRREKRKGEVRENEEGGVTSETPLMKEEQRGND